jgi:hypothetical protein
MIVFIALTLLIAGFFLIYFPFKKIESLPGDSGLFLALIGMSLVIAGFFLPTSTVKSPTNHEQYPNPRNVVFFDLDSEITITDDRTVVLKNPGKYELVRVKVYNVFAFKVLQTLKVEPKN